LDPDLAEFYNCDADLTGGSCENSDWAGDAYCDDGNNNCVCNWDGGDCCGPEHFYNYCDECQCKDPADNTYFQCSGGCDVKKWVGDGYCDDGNNDCGCDWDGGDCCDHNAKTTHCSECLCKDPNYVEPACVGPCEFDYRVGDGYCDDGNNVCGCNWDGGDCCGAGNATQNYFCDDCLCLDPNATDYDPSPAECSGTCGHSDWAADTFCDDMNNNCGCNWDGGDCCGDSNSHKHCDECLCKDPIYAVPCDSECAHSGWAGDGYCDDDNNLCGCDWDGGDCCGDDKNYQQCGDCLCLDPLNQSGSTEEPQPPDNGNTPQPDGSTPYVPPPPTAGPGGGGPGGGGPGGGVTPPPDLVTRPN
jgi:hypothetical protein